MELRDQRVPRAAITDLVRDTDIPDISDTALHASDLCNDDAPFAIALQVPYCHWECSWTPPADPGRVLTTSPIPIRWPVHQFGPRRLFDEVAVAYHRWDQAGRPAATQWRFTVTPDGQRVELDAASWLG